METPFNFNDNDQPEEAKSSGGKLPEGRYNFEFVRVAGADDNAEDGIVSGKNDWKALKLIFKMIDSRIDKELFFGTTFTTDYDPAATNSKGDSKREMLLDMSKANYKALCHFAGADLKNTDSLVGRKVSCLCKKGDNDFLELDPGYRGENWDSFVEQKSESKIEEVKSDTKSEEFDDDIPF
tara:strand:- start:785 stop:1327 length:543 start_codon:yes stop_codon:yes gene_type:complete